MNDEAALIRRAIAVASRAPSLHNSQPWRWVADGVRLELFLDPSRVVTHTDSAGREALIGCGAILDHLRVVMAATERLTTVVKFPDTTDPTHLASVLLHHAGPVPDSTLTVHRDRASAILRRRTDRLPFLAPTDWDLLAETVQGLIDPDAVRLHVVSSELLPELTEGSRLTSEIRRLDVRYHQELDWWTGPFETQDGIPRELLTSVVESERVAVNRVFPATERGNRRPQVHTDQAVVVVLTTPDDTPADALAAGEALSALLIEATVAGLATCTVSHLTELESGRALVRSLIADEDFPQVLVRVGRAPALDGPTVTTPRRPVSDILEFRN